MPSYELSLLLRKLSNPEAAPVLKRAMLKIVENNGILFGVENMGTRALPHKIRMHKENFRDARYFLVKFDAPAAAIEELETEYKRDLDIIRCGFNRIKSMAVDLCTLEEELKPPAYRKDVEEMIKAGRKTELKFEANDGLNYYPWRT